MDTVILTIVFFASAANAQFTTRLDVGEACSCAMLAERWQAYQSGLLKVLSARCERVHAPDGPLAPRAGEEPVFGTTTGTTAGAAPEASAPGRAAVCG